MSDPVSPLGGAVAEGFATVRETGPHGMITLRAAQGTKGLAAAVKAACGAGLPAQRRIAGGGEAACLWMSPDEYLLVMPRAAVADALASLAKSLSSQHHLAVDVSDARAVFRVEGPRAADVLTKLCPVDFERLEHGEVRRTRLAQVACALWADGDGFTVVTFRSAARYAFDLLATAAAHGGEIDPRGT